MTAPVRRIVRGLPAVVINTRPDIDTEQVFLRLDGAVGLIQQYMPDHFRKLSRDFAGFLVERRSSFI